MDGRKLTSDFRSYNDVFKKLGISCISTMISKERILWASKVFKMENYRIPKLLTCRKNIQRLNAHQNLNSTQYKTWYKCLMVDVKNLQIDMMEVQNLKKSELNVKIRKGMIVNDERLQSERTLKSLKRQSKEGDTAAKKKLVQKSMREGKLTKTKTTKTKKRKTKNN